jgi:titin
MPQAIALDSAGIIYTANFTDRNVSKIAPTSYPAPPARPAAPSAVLGSTGSGTATLTVAVNVVSAAFGAPSSYTFTAVQDASRSCTISFLQSSCVVSGLTPGVAYTFTAMAGLVSWQTAASAESNSVTPFAVPAAPTSLVGTPGNASASIAFTAGADNGSAITNYEYSTDDGSTWTARDPGATTSPIVISGLTNGTDYLIRVRAVNSAGTGTASGALSVTPVAPAAPVTTTTPGASTAPVTSTSPAATTPKAVTGRAGSNTSVAQLLRTAGVTAPTGTKTRATTSTPKVCKVTGQKVVFLAAGTCKGVLLVTPKKGKATKKPFAIVVTKTKRA